MRTLRNSRYPESCVTAYNRMPRTIFLAALNHLPCARGKCMKIVLEHTAYASSHPRWYGHFARNSSLGSGQASVCGVITTSRTILRTTNESLPMKQPDDIYYGCRCAACEDTAHLRVGIDSEIQIFGPTAMRSSMCVKSTVGAGFHVGNELMFNHLFFLSRSLSSSLFASSLFQ